MNISLFPHNGSGNHGCEAIVRSTYALLRDLDNLILFSERPDEDRLYMPDVPINRLSPKNEISRFSIQHMRAAFAKHVNRDQDAFARITFDPLVKSCKNGVYLSIGGDLYCYDKPTYLFNVHRYVKEVGAKSVLWGCSVDPELIDHEMEVDLASYDLICARESISYETLKKINPNTILTIDPAFILEPLETQLPADNYVGINVSPMIVERESEPEIVFKNYFNLIDHILASTDYSVALIPHVVWNATDDRTILSELKKRFINENRVVMVGDMNCLKLKYVVSNCRIFIGARTHATIAAYSSNVPTLTVGYSVKAKGIAKDLFGSSDHYVLPVQSLKTPYDLTNAFLWISERESDIRTHLQLTTPSYLKKIDNSVEAIRNIVRKG